jgi:spore coat protein H
MRPRDLAFLVLTFVQFSAAAGCDGGSRRAADAGATGGATTGTGGGGTGGATDTGGTGQSGATATGGASEASTNPTDCEPADPALADADAQQLFDFPSVPHFDFYLPQADWEHLKATAQDEQYTQAELCFEGRRVGTVGLRFKGSYGTLYNCFDDAGQLICPRLSMKVKFDEYDPEQRLFGLKRLNFNAYRFDDSRLKERLTYDLFRAADIVAPRAAWAVLRVNGELQGLYGMVEAVDGRFTADRWPETPDGNLYKEVWPTDASADSIIEGLTTNEEQADVSAFVAFAEAFNAADDAARLGVLGQYVDLDYLARYMAVDDAIANYDGITYLWTDGVTSGNHNYYFYEQAADNFVLVPWDVEGTFWIDPEHAAPHWTVIPDDCSVTYSYWEGLAYAPGCDPVFRALISDLEPWRRASQELLDGPFAENVMLDAIERHAAFIQKEVAADPTPTTYAPWSDAVAGLRSAVPDLRARLETLIATE